MNSFIRLARSQTHPAARLIGLLVGAALLALYALTLQTHISGSFEETTPDLILKNEYIKDVSEIQVALNTWGTVHYTGYPLFTVLGNLFTAGPRALGLEPATAASLYVLTWGGVALLSLGALLVRLTARPALVALALLVLGLARSVWVHNVVAEVYSMSLAIMALLWAVALWPAAEPGADAARRRILWLALLGGIGVSHHRAVAFIAPGLFLALWPHLAQRSQRAALLRTWRHWLPAALGLALLGFVPYLYLPLRAWQDAAWVYGDPGTVAGFWSEFTGREADYLVTLPDDAAGLLDNARRVWDILVHELTLPGLLLALVATALAVTLAPQRHAARALALSASGSALFAVFFHTAVLPQAILMPVVTVLVCQVVLALDWLLDAIALPPDGVPPWRNARVLAGVGLVAWAGTLAGWHYSYVDELVSEPSGVQMIDRLAMLPDDAPLAVMLPWGPRFAAVAYASLVTGDYADLALADHTADFAALRAAGYQLVTIPETFYTYPPPWPSTYGPPGDWWPLHLGALYPTSAAPGWIALQAAPTIIAPRESGGVPVGGGIERRAAWLTCDAQTIVLHIVWDVDRPPATSPSIFVHLQPDEPAPDPPNADQPAPVYGVYPFNEWSPGEIVRDHYVLPRVPGRTQVIVGLYEQSEGGFVNYGELALPLADCLPPGSPPPAE